MFYCHGQARLTTWFNNGNSTSDPTCEANAISITLMAGGEGIYCRSAIQPRARDPLPTAGAGGEHGAATRATTSPHGARGAPLYLRTKNSSHYLELL